MNETARLIRVVANLPSGSGFVRTQGTKLMVGDVDISPCVTSITLHCEINDIWRATVVMSIEPPADIAALAVLHYQTHWQRFKAWARRWYSYA